jgi:hypothetical protein
MIKYLEYMKRQSMNKYEKTRQMIIDDILKLSEPYKHCNLTGTSLLKREST